MALRAVVFCRIVSVEVESAALECLSISVVLCRTRGERGFSVFVDICRIMSVEGGVRL